MTTTLLFSFFIIGAALLANTHAQNILETFSSLISPPKAKFGGVNDIFGQLFNNPNPLSALLGGGAGGLNFDSILKTFQPPSGGDGGGLPDITTLISNGLTDVINIAGSNQSRVNGSTAASRSRPTLSSAESESGGIPIEGGFEPRHGSGAQKSTGFSRASIPSEVLNDPAYLLLNDGQAASTKRSDDDIALEQILRAIEDSNF